ncbi:hypothetical protein HYH02_004736 [Chlamydomonas schloesseri]|uniref:peptidylprolyl isomerase n=1 Tax=Chlamydomonas schloesseri TaxID=2026947 RepID=A0A835WPA2_9CHLO|nr:hypothetical protein HYH02_004736 [Chlamydomonas schloesseri]|eukprot:KAG2450904.1 hypothetical protein HYH02_004736 [Chlamydomonas schloesseri]
MAPFFSTTDIMFRARAAFGASGTSSLSGALGSGGLLLPGRVEAALAGGVSCPGLNGYTLQQCLREARKAREAAEAAADADGSAASGGGGADSVRDERLKYRQFEQPGTLVTLPNGLQYRELLEGTGPEAQLGSICEVSYVVYRLSSGAYYKYSSGGTPVFLFSLGYGQEGKDDVGQTYRFRLGEPNSLPAAVTPALVGMRQGGKRRVLVPPRLGWVSDKVGPRPDTFGGGRRLEGHKDEPLLFEAELVRVRTAGTAGEQQGGRVEEAAVPRGGLFRMPAPPTYYGQQR